MIFGGHEQIIVTEYFVMGGVRKCQNTHFYQLFVISSFSKKSFLKSASVFSPAFRRSLKLHKVSRFRAIPLDLTSSPLEVAPGLQRTYSKRKIHPVRQPVRFAK